MGGGGGGVVLKCKKYGFPKSYEPHSLLRSLSIWLEGSTSQLLAKAVACAMSIMLNTVE